MDTQFFKRILLNQYNILESNLQYLVFFFLNHISFKNYFSKNLSYDNKSVI